MWVRIISLTFACVDENSKFSFCLFGRPFAHLCPGTCVAENDI